MKKIDLSVIICAYNEEKNISGAIRNVVNIVKNLTSSYEIIVVNDGSKDKTKETVENEIKKVKHVKLINRLQNRGMGYSLREGLSKASKAYVTIFPGDNDMSAKSLRNLINEAPESDLIISFPVNRYIRPLPRRLVSTIYVLLLNLLFGLHLQYYNGPFLGKTKLIRNTPLISEGHNIFAELVIRLLKQDTSYTAVPFEYIGRAYGRSKAFTLTNLKNIIISFSILAWDIYVPEILKKI